MDRQSISRWLAVGGSAASMYSLTGFAEANAAGYITKIHRGNAEWKILLTPEQYYVLRITRRRHRASV
jgi:hypothetical protein